MPVSQALMPSLAFEPRAPLETRSFGPLGMTERQRECLFWVQEGKSAADIGGILGISPRTVDEHVARACEHLGVRTRLQAVMRARDLGLLQLSSRSDVGAPRA